jgi:hypothetical protein
MKKTLTALALIALQQVCWLRGADAPGRWSAQKANEWNAGQPWLVGCNFSPSSAVNQLEMWQADTFDETTIARELGFAESLGFNSVRVFLHDLPWKQDRLGYFERIDRFLAIAEKNHINALFVIFDSCWYPLPKTGPQPAPIPFTHNSGWVQSPGVEVLKRPEKQSYLKEYVTQLLTRFANDKRVVGWDVWNEPDNWDGGAKARPGLEPTNKIELVEALLPQVFAWARAANPSQPLTSAVWRDTWNHMSALSTTERTQLENSDVVSFHCYANSGELVKAISTLKKLDRPLWCTEYMARPAGSTFSPHLRLMKEQGVAAYNWGFVSGKTQTIYPWDSWTRKYTAEPPVWFHDILRPDGTPYDAKEAAFIRELTASKRQKPAARQESSP